MEIGNRAAHQEVDPSARHEACLAQDEIPTGQRNWPSSFHLGPSIFEVVSAPGTTMRDISLR